MAFTYLKVNSTKVPLFTTGVLGLKNLVLFTSLAIAKIKVAVFFLVHGVYTLKQQPCNSGEALQTFYPANLH